MFKSSGNLGHTCLNSPMCLSAPPVSRLLLVASCPLLAVPLRPCTVMQGRLPVESLRFEQAFGLVVRYALVMCFACLESDDLTATLTRYQRAAAALKVGNDQTRQDVGSLKLS